MKVQGEQGCTQVVVLQLLLLEASLMRGHVGPGRLIVVGVMAGRPGHD